MPKTMLATTAIGVLLVSGAYAQTTDPAAPPAVEAVPEVAPGEEPAGAAGQAPADAVMPETAGEAGPEAAETEAPATADVAGEATAEREGWGLEEGWTRLDWNTVSTDSLIGSEIRNLEGESVATVGDVLLSADGMVESVVARFGGFLGFGETTVLLSMDEVDIVEDADGNALVRTNLTPDLIEGRPQYEG